MHPIWSQISNIGVVPVVAIEDAANAIPLGEALSKGGLPCAEITFRTNAATDAIQKMANSLPHLLVGAGTILTAEQAKTAVSAGAKFIVTPGFDTVVVDYCLANDIPIAPGVMTPTEINFALSKGLKLLKFFPAEVAGGVKALKAIGGPYQGINFMPTGGINPNNLSEYLTLPNVVACGGSWMVKKELIDSGSFSQITKLSQEVVEIRKRVQG